MADNSTDGTPPSNTSTTVNPNLTVPTQQQIQNVNVYNSGITQTVDILSDLDKAYTQAGISLSNVDKLAGSQVTTFGLLSNAIIGTQQAFGSLNNIRTDGLTTFDGSAKNLINTLKGTGTVMGAATGIGKEFADMLVNMTGGSINGQKIMSMTGETLAKYAEGLLVSADNQLRFSNAMIQSAAQAGNLGQAFSGIAGSFSGFGEQLDHTDTALNAVQSSMANAMHATNTIDPNVMGNYATQLMQIPGGLQAITEGTNLLGVKTNTLSDIIQYAQGSGRDYSEVLKEVKSSVVNYGLSIGQSLEFTSKMTDLSTNLNVPLEQVQSSLMTSADHFKMYSTGGEGAARMTQGLTAAMNEYVGSLRDVGVPAANAAGMFQNMSDQMGKMGIAQKAFLSSQTGGPGGLMGAFQVDKMLNQGDFKKVYDMMQKQMKQQLGSIVTLDQASQSQGAANQYARQIQILKNGPMGQFAKTDADAERLLESMQKGKPPAQLDQTQNALNSTIQRGARIEQLGKTQFSEKSIEVATAQMAAATANLLTITNAFAARSAGGQGGVDATGRSLANENQMQLRNTQTTAQHSVQMDLMTNTLRNISQLSNLPQSLKSSANSIFDSLKSGNVEGIQDKDNRLMTEGRAWASQGSTLQEKQQREGEVNKLQTALNEAMQNSRTDNTAGRQVGKAASQMTGQERAHTQPIPVTVVGNIPLHVNVKSANCPHCNNPISDHTTATNAATK